PRLRRYAASPPRSDRPLPRLRPSGREHALARCTRAALVPGRDRRRSARAAKGNRIGAARAGPRGRGPRPAARRALDELRAQPALLPPARVRDRVRGRRPGRRAARLGDDPQAVTPKRFPNRQDAAAVRELAVALADGETGTEVVRIAGRIMARRGHGGIAFLDLVDRSGTVQLVAQDMREAVQDLDLGDIVGVAGHPMKTKRGEPSVSVTQLELLAKIRSPLPDTFHGLTDVEQRYRRRYLDLLM